MVDPNRPGKRHLSYRQSIAVILLIAAYTLLGSALLYAH